jgi:hypothetical protein
MAQDAPQGRLGVTRRIFVGTLAGVFAAGNHLVLEAIAAETMPHRLIATGVEKAPFFELRDYGGANVAAILERHGIRAVLEENGRFLFAFESLAERERAWREVSADAEWQRAEVREIAVYRLSA